MDIDYQQVYQCIKIIVPNFRDSVSTIKKKSGRPLVRIPEVGQNVQQIVEAGGTSLNFHKAFKAQVNLNYGTRHTILKKDINLFPYKIRLLCKTIAHCLQKVENVHFILFYNFLNIIANIL
jgi:hypothetical protein